MAKHATKGAARVEQTRLERLGLDVLADKPGKVLNVFRCSLCGLWHVGHHAPARVN